MSEDLTNETDLESTETSLTIRRTFDAPRARVWRAFPEPEQVGQWLGPGSMTGEVYALELEPGGADSVSMSGERNRYTVEGEVPEVVGNERLVDTWEPGCVTIELRDADEGREVMFTMRASQTPTPPTATRQDGRVHSTISRRCFERS